MGMGDGERGCGGPGKLGNWELNILEICGSYVSTYLLELIGKFLHQSF